MKEGEKLTKKLLLIHPVPDTNIINMSSVSLLNLPPLSLGYIAALTPSDWKIQIIDENVERYKNEEADLVGITSTTSSAPRAYELAFHFRKKGIPTIMGGIHASMLPDEALNFVDSVIIGEAEEMWDKIIKDFENNQLKRTYDGNKSQLNNIPNPRRDLYSNKYRSKMKLIQTARGCPMNCEFCSVSAFNGNIHRQRTIESVLDELETVNSKLIFFIDDNILGYGKNSEKRAIELFKGIVEKGLNIKWGSQAPINFVDNKKVLKYAQKSGCFGLFIGFESLNEKSLKEMHKVRNLQKGVKKYKNVIRRFHDYGIGVFGAFMFGSDSDKMDIFKRTIEFVLDSKMDGSQFSILTPLPGTKLYEKMNKDNRILLKDYPNDWKYYNTCNVVFKPKNMTPVELKNGIVEVYKATTSMSKCVKRAFNSFLETKNILTAMASFKWNRDFGINFLKRYAT